MDSQSTQHTTDANPDAIDCSIGCVGDQSSEFPIHNLKAEVRHPTGLAIGAGSPTPGSVDSGMKSSSQAICRTAAHQRSRTFSTSPAGMGRE